MQEKDKFYTPVLLTLTNFVIVFFFSHKDSKIDLLDGASAVKKKLNKVSNTTDFFNLCKHLHITPVCK